MALRTNPRHYWSFSRKMIQNHPGDRRDVLQEGLITGDFHYQNMAARRQGDRWKVDFVDLDDGGRGPFIFDLVRFMVASRLVDTPVNESRLVDAYLRGLRGEKDEKPARVAKIHEADLKEIEKSEREFVEKHTHKSRFKAGHLDLTPFAESPKAERDVIAKAARQLARRLDGEVLDRASRRRMNGGSQGFLRVWTLLKIDGENRIFEAKELGEPALAYWGPQKPTESRVRDLMNSYWGETRDDYGIIRAAGRYFWFRPRVKKSFRTDLPSGNYLSSRENYREEMEYFANYLGRRHSAQKVSRDFVKFATGNVDVFRRDLRDFADRHETEIRRQYDRQFRP